MIFFSQEGIYVLDILFCVTKHDFTLVDTLLFKMIEYAVPQEPKCTAWKSSDFVKIGFECLVSRKWIVGPKFFEENGGEVRGLDLQSRLLVHIVYDILGIFEKYNK